MAAGERLAMALSVLPQYSSPFFAAQPYSFFSKTRSHFGVWRWNKGLCIVSQASDGRNEKESEDKGFFSFVVDNPSSRSAIQLPNSPAQDGNAGQMIAQIKDKGRDYGSYVRSGEFTWFVRETGSRSSKNGTIVFLHGAPASSYSYRDVIVQMAGKNYHCYAPDWLGFGFSEMPQPKFDFSYTEEAYHEELDKLLDKLKIQEPFFLVVQGFVVGSYGLTWALKNQSKISKLAILNCPLTTSAPTPALFTQMRIPILGEFVCQNAIMAERFIEKGSKYSLDLDDCDVYRLPYLSSSAPGFAILEATRNFNSQQLLIRVGEGFSSKSWNVPVAVIWGEDDKYLPQTEATNFANSNTEFIKATLLSGTGHMPQEDWPEKVVDALTGFLS